MNKQPDPSTYAAEVRRQAEAKWQERMQRDAASPAPPADPQRLLHELQVHQIELEMQNEDLIQARSQLEDLLDLYTDLYDFAPVGYCTLAQDGGIQQINLTGATLLGVARGNLFQRRFGFFVAPASRPVFSDFLARVFADQGKEQCEIALQKEGDAPLWVHLEARLDEKQNCRAVLMDITERKQAEEALSKSEARFRIALENAPITVFNQDQELRYTWIYNLHPGFDPQMTLGKTDAELLPADDAARLTEIKRRVLETGATAREEVRTTIGGQAFFYDLTVEPLRDTSRNIIGVTCVALDITERKRAEGALTAERNLLRTLIDNIPDYIYVKDTQGRFLLGNKAGAQSVGLQSAEEMLGKTDFDFFPPAVANEY